MADENESLLIDSKEYLKSGIHIGTKFKTKYMAKFIYKTRPDGLSVLNLQQIDERVALAANFLAQYEPDEILITCRRENGWKAAKKFAKTIGAKFYVGRYPAGVITNPQLKTFIEPGLMFVADPRGDKNAVKDAYLMKIPILALCDTNNTLRNVDVAIACNNKGAKSLGLVYWILATEYLKATGQKVKLKLEDFIE